MTSRWACARACAGQFSPVRNSVATRRLPMRVVPDVRATQGAKAMSNPKHTRPGRVRRHPQRVASAVMSNFRTALAFCAVAGSLGALVVAPTFANAADRTGRPPVAKDGLDQVDVATRADSGGPVAVVRSGPSGQVSASSVTEFTWLFDRPMSVLGNADIDAASATPGTTPEAILNPGATDNVSLSIEPALPGSLRWASPRLLVFTPSQTPAVATRYRATLSTATALDGTELAKPQTLSFETAGPSCGVAEAPNWASAPAEPTLLIACDQPVDPTSLASRVSLTHRSIRRSLIAPSSDELREMRAADPAATDQLLGAISRLERPSTAIGSTHFTAAASAPCPKSDPPLSPVATCYLLSGATALPDDARTSVQIIAGLLPAGSSGANAVAGVSAALGEYETAATSILESILCAYECAPGTGVGLYPVSFEPVDLDGHVKVNDLSDPSKSRTFKVPPTNLKAAREQVLSQALTLEWFNFLPGHRYEVRIDAGVKTQPTGRPTPSVWVRRFGFGRQPASLDIATGEVVLERGKTSSISVQSRNIRALRIARRTVPRRELVAAIRAFGTSAAEWSRLPATAMQITAAADATVSTPIRIGPKDGEPGAVEIVAVQPTAWVARSVYSSQPDNSWSAALIQVTDMAIQLKESPTNTLVSVTSISTGLPVAGALVELHGDPVSTEGKAPQFWSGRTDKDGFAWAPPRPSRTCKSCRTIAIVTKGDDLAYAHASWSALSRTQAYGSTADADVDGDGTVTRVEQASFDQARKYGPIVERDGDPVTVVLWADRGIVKPGEEVRVAGVLRTVTPRRLDLPVAKSLPIRVRDSRNGIVLEKIVPVGKNGRIELSFTVPAAAPLGPFSVEAGGASTGFEVAEFRTPRFEAALSGTPSEIAPGDTATLTATGKYLFGAPMSGMTTSWTARFIPTYFDPFSVENGVRPPKDHDTGWAWVYQCAIGRECATGSPEWESRGESVLDTAGRTELREAVPVRTTAGVPLSLVVEAVVHDVDRQIQAAQTSILVHQAKWYAGVRTPQRAIPKGDPIRVDVAGVTSTGEWVKGQAAKVELVRWTSTASDRVSQNEEVDRVGVWTESLVTSKDITLGEGPQIVSFAEQPIGTYEIRVTGIDDAGNHVEASSIVDVAPLAQAGPSVAATSVDPCANPDAAIDENVSCDTVAEMSIVLDRNEYQPGDTARILIRSPFPVASGVLTVERAEVQRAQRFTIEGSRGVVEVPIAAEDIPGFTVAVTLHRPIVATVDRVSADARLGRLRVTRGSVDILVPNSAAKLSVDVTTKAEYRPGDRATFDLHVSEPEATTPNGKTPNPVDAVVTLWAVDDAVVNLTGYRPPNLVSEMYPWRGGVIETSDNEQDLVVSGSFAKLKDAKDAAAAYPLVRRRAGGGGGEDDSSGGGSVRTDLRAVAFWKGAVSLGRNGRATVDVDLPENLTRFRVFAVASSGADRFGTADTTFRISRPFVLSAALPRFLTPGDSVELGAVVTNPGTVPGEATVRLALSGAAARANGPVEQSVHLEPGASAEVRFAVDALAEGPLPVELRGRFVRQIGDGESSREEVLQDGMAVTIPVVFTQRLVTTAEVGTLAPGASQAVPVQVSGAADPKRGGLVVAASGTRLAGLQGGVAELLDYPFGCLEQTTSRLRALMYLGDLRASFSLPDLPSAAELRKRTEAELAGLTRFENTDGGGLSYWPGSPDWPILEPDTFLSARTLILLEDAQDLGLKIPVGLRDRLVTYLQATTQSSLNDGLYDGDDLFADQRNPLWWSRVEVLAALARAGHPERGLALSVAEDRFSLSALEKVALVRALAEGPATASPAPTTTIPDENTGDGADDSGSSAATSQDSLSARLATAVSASATAPTADAKPKAETPAALDARARTMAGRLMAELLDAVQVDGERATLPSAPLDSPLTYFVDTGIHDTAALLSTLVRVDPKHPLVDPLAAGILAARKNGSWGNTIENGYALAALVDAERLAGTRGRGTARLDVTLPSGKVGTITATARSLQTNNVSVPLDVLANAFTGSPGDLTLRNRGDAPAYWSARLSLVPTVKSLRALDSGFSVRRAYRVRAAGASESAKPVTEFAAGDLIEVELLITSAQRRYDVAIDDALPAGFEIVDTSLGGASSAESSETTTETTTDGPIPLSVDFAEQRDRAARFFTGTLPPGTSRVSYLVRATSIGKFMAAPTTVEEMYRPEVSGRTDSTPVIVR